MFFAACVMIGLAAGFLSALLGVGGGVVIVPLLLVLAGVEMKVAVGTSLACIVPIALAGTFLKHSGNQVDWRIALVVVPFGVLGAYLGDKLSDATPDVLLKQVFGVLMLLVAVKMILFPGGWEGLLRPKARAADSNGAETQQDTQPPENGSG